MQNIVAAHRYPLRPLSSVAGDQGVLPLGGAGDTPAAKPVKTRRPRIIEMMGQVGADDD